MEIIGPNTARDLWLVTALWLGRYEPAPPPHSHIHNSNLALGDFYYFGLLNKQLGSKQIVPVVDMKQAVNSRLQKLNLDFSYTGKQALVPWWDKC